MKLISRGVCLKKYPQFPVSNNLKEKYFYPSAQDSFILSIASKSVRGHLNKLSEGISQLIQNNNSKNIIFLGDTSVKWLHQKNSAKQIQETFLYLKRKKFTKSFNGGVIVSIEEIAEFLPHIYWLTSLNAASPIINFMDENQNIVGNICPYGNFHISTLNKNASAILKNLIIKKTFIKMKSCK